MGRGWHCYFGERSHMDTAAKKKLGMMEKDLKYIPTVTLTAAQSENWGAKIHD